jgi:hypothetical protein
MEFKSELKNNKRTPFITTIVLFTAMIVLIIVMNSNSVIAQSTEGVNTFSAKGYMGNLLLPPEAMESLNASQDTNMNFVIGGDWSFDVSNGQLQDFKVELNKHSLSGHEVETHIIDGLDNATSITNTAGNNQIILIGNNTQFKGLADIETVETGKVWQDVPILVYLINGHIHNVHFDAAKTEGHFLNLPLLGVVTSLTEGSTSNQANATATMT